MTLRAEDRLREDLLAQEPPQGSLERAAARLKEELPSAEPAGRSRGSRIAAGAIALGVAAAVALFTPVGQAAVDWVRDAVHIDTSETDKSGFFGQTWAGEQLGQGSTPGGDPYVITAFANEGRKTERCLGIGYPAGGPDAAADADGAAFCDYPQAMVDTIGRVIYEETADGGAVAFGVAAPEVATLVYDYAEGEDTVTGEADVFPLRGTITEDDGSVDTLEPANFFVLFLPPGIGEVGTGSEVEARGISESGEELATATLGFAKVSMDPRGGDEHLFSCGSQPFWPDTCRDAVSGEIDRISPKFARPVPSELATALAARGYTVAPVSGDDRETAAGLDFSGDILRHALEGTQGLHYERLVRISGDGLEDQLAYLAHMFRIEPMPGGGGSSTEATSIPNPPSALTPEATTHLFDAESGDELRVIEWPDEPAE